MTDMTDAIDVRVTWEDPEGNKEEWYFDDEDTAKDWVAGKVGFYVDWLLFSWFEDDDRCHRWRECCVMGHTFWLFTTTKK